jgi:NAD(P)H-hydrate repair Nnr-like enzyme with NAD(P)H-hydrate epimerase domain
MVKYISQAVATQIDVDLMAAGAYSLDQLMELAGLSVAETVYKTYPPSKSQRILVIAGPGNNGGDALVGLHPF